MSINKKVNNESEVSLETTEDILKAYTNLVNEKNKLVLDYELRYNNLESDARREITNHKNINDKLECKIDDLKCEVRKEKETTEHWQVATFFASLGSLFLGIVLCCSVNGCIANNNHELYNNYDFAWYNRKEYKVVQSISPHPGNSKLVEYYVGGNIYVLDKPQKFNVGDTIQVVKYHKN